MFNTVFTLPRAAASNNYYQRFLNLTLSICSLLLSTQLSAQPLAFDASQLRLEANTEQLQSTAVYKAQLKSNGYVYIDKRNFEIKDLPRSGESIPPFFGMPIRVNAYDPTAGNAYYVNRLGDSTKLASDATNFIRVSDNYTSFREHTATVFPDSPVVDGFHVFYSDGGQRNLLVNNQANMASLPENFQMLNHQNNTAYGYIDTGDGPLAEQAATFNLVNSALSFIDLKVAHNSYLYDSLSRVPEIYPDINTLPITVPRLSAEENGAYAGVAFSVNGAFFASGFVKLQDGTTVRLSSSITDSIVIEDGLAFYSGNDSERSVYFATDGSMESPVNAENTLVLGGDIERGFGFGKGKNREGEGDLLKIFNLDDGFIVTSFDVGDEILDVQLLEDGRLEYLANKDGVFVRGFVSTVPLPASAWLFISAISGLLITRKAQIK